MLNNLTHVPADPLILNPFPHDFMDGCATACFRGCLGRDGRGHSEERIFSWSCENVPCQTGELTSGESISDHGVPRMSHARQAEQFRDAREFKVQICAWLRSRMSMGMRLSTARKGRRIVDAATCARDVYHREHRGASCTDFNLKLQCGKLCAILVFLPRAPSFENNHACAHRAAYVHLHACEQYNA